MKKKNRNKRGSVLDSIEEIPIRPGGFRGLWDESIRMPSNVRPKGRPRNVIFLASVEWSWTPWHSRQDRYYLGSRGRYWILWRCWLDDSDSPIKWRWFPYSYATNNGIETSAAAVFLLMHAWSAEKESEGLDGGFLICDSGYLSDEVLIEIADGVWGVGQPRV